jgi:hypothetical protein
MANPLIHAIVLLAAIAVPGGLLIYFAWAAHKARKKKVNSQLPTPEEARSAFRAMYPPDSLRGQSRLNQLNRARACRRRNPQ